MTKYRWQLFAILALSALLRLLWPGADLPPPHDAFFLTDEGWWLHNARNAALFGNWNLDDFNQGLVYAPLYSLLVRTVWSVTGVSLTVARLLSGLAGVCTAYLVGQAARRWWGDRAGLAATALLGFDWLAVRVDRLAFPEPMLIALAVAGLCAWADQRPLRAGLLIGASLLVKISAAPALVVAGLLLWRDRAGRRSLLRFTAGLAVPGLALAVLWTLHLPSLRQMSTVTAHFNQPASALNLITNLLQFPSISVLVQSGLVAFGCWGFLAWRGQALARPTQCDRLEYASLCWLVGNSLFIAPLRFHPDHRYSVLLPVMALLAARWLTSERADASQVLGDASASLRSGRWLPAMLLAFPVAFLPAQMLAFLAGLRYHGVVQTLLFPLLFCGWLLLIHDLPLWLSRRAEWFRRAPALLTATAVTVSIWQAGRFYTHPTFDLQRLGERVERELPAGSTLIGLPADTVALSSPALILTNRLDLLNPDVALTHPPDYLMVMAEIDGTVMSRANYFEGNEPLLRLMDQAEPAGSFTIGPEVNGRPRFLLRLYRVTDPQGR